MREQDAQRLEQEAHALKGSSGNMGATGIARISSKLKSIGERKTSHTPPGYSTRWTRSSVAFARPCRPP